MLRVPEAVPDDFGLKETCRTASCPGARDRPEEKFEALNPAPVTVRPWMVSGASPLFLSAISFALCEFRL
jgi:hypothetical protein